MKKLLVTGILLSCAMAHAGPAETQAMTDAIISTFSVSNFQIPEKLNSETYRKSIDPASPLTATIEKVTLETGSALTLKFNDNEKLQIAVNPKVLGEVIKSGEANYTPEGALVMTKEAKSRATFGSVNTRGVVEARNVVFKNGVVYLVGE